MLTRFPSSKNALLDNSENAVFVAAGLVRPECECEDERMSARMSARMSVGMSARMSARMSMRMSVRMCVRMREGWGGG